MFTPLRVSRVDRLCEDSVALTFEVPANGSYDFEAGQYLTVRRIVDGAEQRRSYSVCAEPSAAPRIGVREVAGGALSTWLVHDVAVGDEIEVDSPAGRFTCAGIQGGRHLLIAAGSGITPVLSLARTLLATGAEVTLLYGNRRTNSVMFADELADLKDSHLERFRLIHVLSREPRDVALFSGRLDAGRIRELIDQLVPVQGLDHAWLCGPFGMLTDARAALTEAGLPTDRIHYELFYVEEAPPDQATHVDVAPVGETSRVSVILDGKQTTSDLPSSMTILDGAQQVRADLPFACKGGVCGTCRAKLTEGEADMRRNYALEPGEVEAGFVLTCQTWPVSAELTVDYDA